MLKDQKSTYSGLLFVTFGAILIVYSLSTLETGTVARMGPGLMPILYGSGLLLIGAAVILTANQRTSISPMSWPWRSIFFVSAAIVCFAAGLKPLGFMGATFGMALLSALARRKTSLLHAVLIAAVIAAFCALVFIYALGIPLPLVGF
ncbi:tripartite tricarboxylate transporter TctB family protein [Aminobacter aminovorans]|uniref:Tricarboxylic transport membrane protein n=1 Tax=Aminobacter aminovorans TaxID=83263 RepID=A0AAC9FD53_AMIAI|nr:tripartite tricarboxylate transporter TctB family protein [Aminobacter aminovorans]AMS40123.1 hypothetical protein AA2016_1187 [Aminobacter aminovorans]MBB3710130.1 putative tricarboxylic transport membrane protein [Aminobacter aminovorans]